MFERQPQGIHDSPGDPLMPQTLGARVFHRLVDGAAQQAKLDEIVEMSGLQRGILAIVGEAQQLARAGVKELAAA